MAAMSEECPCFEAVNEGYVGARIYDSIKALEHDVKELGLVAGTYRVVEVNGDDEHPEDRYFYLHIKDDWAGWLAE